VQNERAAQRARRAVSLLLLTMLVQGEQNWAVIIVVERFMEREGDAESAVLAESTGG